MTLATMLKAWAWSLIAFFVAVVIALVVNRVIFGREDLPHRAIWFWSAFGVALAAGAVFAILRRPTPQQAAVSIDQQLALKEKFSTALFIRASKDPFAAAAVRDAEKTAENVSLRKRFPVQFPLAGMGTLGAALCAALVAWLLPTFDLFGV